MGGSNIDGVGRGGGDYKGGGAAGGFDAPGGDGPKGEGVGQGGGRAEAPSGLGRGRETADGQRGTNRAGGDNKHADGPGNNGQGNAYGHDKKAGRNDAPDAGKPARVHEIENQVQQVRTRIENLTKSQQPPGTERLGDDLPGRDRARDVTQTRGGEDYGDDHDIRFRSQTDNDRARVGEGDRARSGRHEGDHDHGRRGRSGDDDGGDGWRFRSDERGSRGDGLRFDPSGPGRNGRGHAYGHDKHSPGPLPPDALTGTVAGTLGRTTDLLADVVRDLGRALRHDSPPLLESAAAYLRGQTDGADLAPETRAALRTAADTLGPDFLSHLDGRRADKVFKIVERALEHLGRAVEHAQHKGESFVRLPGDGRIPLEQATRTLGRAAAAPDQLARELVDELLGAVLLNRYVRRLEKTGGQVVQQAEAKLARALYGAPGEGQRPPATQPGGGWQPAGNSPAPPAGATPPPGASVTPGTSSPFAPFAPQPRAHPQEVLRDLRAGAFLPPQEQFNPFPLTGRARVAAEMMELMRTLDAVEGALQRATAHAGEAQKANTEAAFVAWLKSGALGAADGAVEELLSLVLPALPGRAARWEIPRLVAELQGLLTDAEGRALLARDGTPLRLDRLLWLGAAGGLLGSAFEGEHAPSSLSPLTLYGFDAVYTVVGFDGRTLASPHFVAVQSAVNNSQFEWVFGHEPFTDGWVRELIERLKDSAVVEHNLFGETLEDALNDGRFHVALLSVEVEEGAPVHDATSVTRLLPGAAGNVAFA